MSGIDWTFFGAQGGDPIESFVATCLLKRYGDTRRVQPARGDGGIDIERDTPDGLVVWQVKRFTTPLSKGQRSQVQSSWQRFHREHVQRGRKIARYALVTPWNPTNGARDWFADLTEGQSFEVGWDGEPFFNGLAADFPEVVALYTRGAAAFDDQLIAKAVIAGSPIEVGPPATMLDALDVRQDALRGIRDQLDPNYVINVSERTFPAVDRLPTIGPDEAGVMHRFTHLGNGRWSIASVVPRSSDARAVSPINLSVRFNAEPGSHDAAKLREFELWGVPFENVEAETFTTGGPFADTEPTVGLISFGTNPPSADAPDVILRLTTAGGQVKQELFLTATALTRGYRGGGVRLVARSRTGAVEFEVRMGSEFAENMVEVRFPSTPGKSPTAVVRDLEWITRLAVGDVAELVVDDVGTPARFTDLQAPNGAVFSLRVAQALSALVPHTTEPMPMPDVREVTSHQLERAEHLARIYSGHAHESRWERLSLMVQGTEPRLAATLANSPAVLAHVEQPALQLGEQDYLITREMVTQFLTPRLPAGAGLAELKVGDEFELVPGDDDRVVSAVIVDSEP